MPNKRLSGPQIRHFKDIGFLKITGVVPSDLVRQARATLISDLNAPTGLFYKNSDGMAFKLYGLLERGGPYEKIIKLKRILQIIEDLVGPDVVYSRNRHNHGSLNRAGDNVVALHRDVLRAGLVTIIVYLENVTIETGPTILVPGSHLWPYAPAGHDGIYLDSISHPAYSELHDQAMPVLVDAGDILVLESTVFHSATQNVTDKTRASLVLGYRAVDELTGVLEETECLVLGLDLYRGNIVVPRRSR